jgi:hypothetical protein
MEITNRKNFWELLQDPPANVSETNALIEWSMNYDIKKGTPYHLFLDLIGYSHENYGENLFKGNPRDVLGFMEIDYLGDALKEYANNPQEVEEWIDAINEAEANK